MVRIKYDYGICAIEYMLRRILLDGSHLLTLKREVRVLRWSWPAGHGPCSARSSFKKHCAHPRQNVVHRQNVCVLQQIFTSTRNHDPHNIPWEDFDAVTICFDSVGNWGVGVLGKLEMCNCIFIKQGRGARMGVPHQARICIHPGTGRCYLVCTVYVSCITEPPVSDVRCPLSLLHCV